VFLNHLFGGSSAQKQIAKKKRTCLSDALLMWRFLLMRHFFTFFYPFIGGENDSREAFKRSASVDIIWVTWRDRNSGKQTIWIKQSLSQRYVCVGFNSRVTVTKHSDYFVWKDASERLTRRYDNIVDKKRVNYCVLKYLFLSTWKPAHMQYKIMIDWCWLISVQKDLLITMVRPTSMTCILIKCLNLFASPPPPPPPNDWWWFYYCIKNSPVAL